MSQAGILEYAEVDTEDGDWIEIAADDSESAAPGSPILAAISAARDALLKGKVASVQIDTDELNEIDELDDAAIRAFFSEAE